MRRIGLLPALKIPFRQRSVSSTLTARTKFRSFTETTVFFNLSGGASWMLIACLAWGSLVWDPRDLPVRREWFADGPLLPIEFAGRSGNGRVTLVLLDKAPVVRSLWALMSISDLQGAKEALADREEMKSPDKTKNIGCWSMDEKTDGVAVEVIEEWANGIDIDAVVWTALGAKIGNKTECRSDLADKVIEYLHSLPLEKRQNAERYIRKAPRQIDTEVRRRIEREFGWLPMD